MPLSSPISAHAHRLRFRSKLTSLSRHCAFDICSMDFVRSDGSSAVQYLSLDIGWRWCLRDIYIVWPRLDDLLYIMVFVYQSRAHHSLIAMSVVYYPKRKRTKTVQKRQRVFAFVAVGNAYTDELGFFVFQFFGRTIITNAVLKLLLTFEIIISGGFRSCRRFPSCDAMQTRSWRSKFCRQSASLSDACFGRNK